MCGTCPDSLQPQVKLWETGCHGPQSPHVPDVAGEGLSSPRGSRRTRCGGRAASLMAGPTLPEGGQASLLYGVGQVCLGPGKDKIEWSVDQC